MRLATAPTPEHALGASGHTVTTRLRRMLTSTAPLPMRTRVATLTTAAGALTLPAGLSCTTVFAAVGVVADRMLIDVGADPNAAVERSWHAETPLHWAASSDDVEVARALIDGSADIEAPGASIAGGTPLDDAIGYGCWQVARLLVQRGARVDRLWHATALGMISRAQELIAAAPPTQQQLTDAFWQACHGGQRRMAEHLLALGADLNGTPSWGDDTPLDIAESLDTGREALVTSLRERGAQHSTKTTP
jgi:ankyrin repeat protein